MSVGLLVIAAWCAPALGLPQDGCIGGVVTNRSRGGELVAGAHVTLLQDTGRGFVLVDETTTDPAGRFLFQDLIASPHIRYQAAAQFAGIHYPGPSIQLTKEHTTAAAVLTVRDIVHDPNPLVVRHHEISLRPAPGLLEVTESLCIENPLPQTYVGPEPTTAEETPTTLKLSIPAEFQKVTFHQEAVGRAFTIRDENLITTMPWEPGQRDVAFTYVLRNSQTHRVWERPLDLPTDAVRVQVTTPQPDRVLGNLRRDGGTAHDLQGHVAYVARATALPAGHVVRLELDRLPVPWTVYGKWLAIVLLATLITAHGVLRRRRGRAPQQNAHGAQPNSASPPARSPARRQSPGPQRRLRRAA